MPITYSVTAFQITVYFNREGDHDHNGLIFALTANVPVLKYLEARSHDEPPSNLQTLYDNAKPRADVLKITLPPPLMSGPGMMKAIRDARAHSLMRPLVLRTNVRNEMHINLKNEIKDRWIGLHLVSDGYDVKVHDGSHVGKNPHSLVKPGDTRKYIWNCTREGVYPFHDGGNYSGGEDGTNVHGLFGALIVEPQDTIWRDPVTGRTSLQGELDGLYLDVIPSTVPIPAEVPTPSTTLSNHVWDPPKPYFNFNKQSHREFVIFFHDEPEFVPPHHHGEMPENPCPSHHACGHGHDLLPIMPVSYRAEPMINREHILWELLKTNPNPARPVLNEEQHHSSWMFGDPATPILKAYIGDPVRIRLVHAGVKETHVFHLHLYEWHTVPQDRNSPRIDAISISPQTAHTIEPVWGAGNRHQVAGDVIWHCHLYPHFHEGMWGMFRTFETLQTGIPGDPLNSTDPVYAGRRIGLYPDGTPIERLLPLPDRMSLTPGADKNVIMPRPTPSRPGYPLYIPGKMQIKSPIPPWVETTAFPWDPAYNYRQNPTDLEKNAFNENPVPGELFTRHRFAKGQKWQWDETRPGDEGDQRPGIDFLLNGTNNRQVHHPIAVEMMKIVYNHFEWHDKHGHLFYLENEGHPDTRRGQKEPLFFRALHGQILNLTLSNKLPATIPETEFDHAFPPCPALPWQGECALHVHMVKFDPICADGASVGWNYMSGPVLGKKMIYRWWLDQEFGSIFFHDHLFANYRQKHGLFGALIVEPLGAKFFNPFTNRPIVSGLHAKIKLPDTVQKYVALDVDRPDTNWFREFCIGIGDFIPMWDKDGNPLNPPECPGGHGDQGAMALNYRSEPIRERMNKISDPADWFSSRPIGDPSTTPFTTYSDDPIWFRLIQGSHEEQHSFQVHGMRWRRFRVNTDSPIRNQQTFGIAEAFTFINHERYEPGDYMYKLSGADDLWLGCWGIIRAFPAKLDAALAGGLLPLEDETVTEEPQQSADTAVLAEEARPCVSRILPGEKFRHFTVRAVLKRLVYREPDLIDPFGIIYVLESITDQDGNDYRVQQSAQHEPLILRCREDEWVKLTLINGLPQGIVLKPEPFAPQVPVEEVNPFSHRPERPVSSQVSMHADLVKYQVRCHDGANVGFNNRQTVSPGGQITYEWSPQAPAQQTIQEPLGPVLLQDMADFRNHRHHGLIGALIIERAGDIPYRVEPGDGTAKADAPEAWNGARATIVTNDAQRGLKYEEAVLLLQDGLRFFLRGHIHSPVPDEPPGFGEDDVDPEDQGQKGFNYRSEPVGTLFDPDLNTTVNPPEEWLSMDKPATPIFFVNKGSRVRMHLVGACDKPRNHSFTIHGVSWPEWRFLSQSRLPMVSSESAITCGTERIFEFTVVNTGDHAYRSGVLKWAVPQGLWGIIRVLPTDTILSSDIKAE